MTTTDGIMTPPASAPTTATPNLKQTTTKRTTTPTTTCPSCRSTDIEYDAALGQSFCAVCGAVLEESAVVAELTFSETAGGSSVLQGQFVSSEQGKVSAPSIFGRRMDLKPTAGTAPSNESRETTIANGRRRIAQVALALSLSEHHVDMAQRWYILALQHQFTRGRRSQNIVAACLYIVCRQEKTPHMLLDFSDVLHTSVYSLGGTFLRLVRLLNLEIPIVDPSFYVGRFASRLEFGDRQQQVANTALRVVARMKRDWIQVGRRPAGVCAAGLIIAARMHGFRRTERQVVQVVHICEATLRKRLDEFAATPSSALTPEQFEGIWLEQEADPPAFRSDSQLDAVGSGKQRRVPRRRKNAVPGEGLLQFIDVEKIYEAPPLMSTKIRESDTLSDVDDDLDIRAAIIADPDEVSRKTAMWTALNKDYLDRQAEKMAIAIKADQETAPKRKRGQSRRKENQAPAGNNNNEMTPAEAAKQALATKKLSKKINYEALDNLLKVK